MVLFVEYGFINGRSDEMLLPSDYIYIYKIYSIYTPYMNLHKLIYCAFFL